MSTRISGTERVTRLFPLWAILGSLLAAAFPEPFVALKPAIVPLLGVVMFGMGMALAPPDFATALRRPGVVTLGVALQYGLMPLIAWLLATAFALPTQLAAGLVLVGACPGGTASNVICYLAGGDLALSITLTTLSTLLALIGTPLLTWLYIGQQVPVPMASMLLSILKIIIAPVAFGMLANRLWGKRMEGVKHLFPLVSVIAIVVIIAIIVALNRDRLVTLALPVLLLVMLHNLAGLGGGYWIPRLLGLDQRICRTIAIEVGMQNSGLGVALATKYFSAAAALPGAVFSIWHNLSGSALAAWWSRRGAP